MDESAVLQRGETFKATFQRIHARQYGHKDVKAANVFVTTEGEQSMLAFEYVRCKDACDYYHLSAVCADEYMLRDFGSACLLDRSAHEQTLTHGPAESSSTSLAATD